MTNIASHLVSRHNIKNSHEPEPMGIIGAVVFCLLIFFSVWASVSLVFLLGNIVGWK
jgi:hypothetical protein